MESLRYKQRPVSTSVRSANTSRHLRTFSIAPLRIKPQGHIQVFNAKDRLVRRVQKENQEARTKW